MFSPRVQPVPYAGASPHAPVIVKRYTLHVVPAPHGSVAVLVEKGDAR